MRVVRVAPRGDAECQGRGDNAEGARGPNEETGAERRAAGVRQQVGEGAEDTLSRPKPARQTGRTIGT